MADDIKTLDDLKSAVSGTPAAAVDAAINREPQIDSQGRS